MITHSWPSAGFGHKTVADEDIGMGSEPRQPMGRGLAAGVIFAGLIGIAAVVASIADGLLRNDPMGVYVGAEAFSIGTTASALTAVLRKKGNFWEEEGKASY